MKLRCVCCGNILSEEEAESSAFPLLPLSCYDCRDEVETERKSDFPSWPAGWYGYCNKDVADVWYTWQKEDGL